MWRFVILGRKESDQAYHRGKTDGLKEAEKMKEEYYDEGYSHGFNEGRKFERSGGREGIKPRKE